MGKLNLYIVDSDQISISYYVNSLASKQRFDYIEVDVDVVMDSDKLTEF